MEKVGIGVDVGGTSVKLGLFQPDGTILKKWEFPTDTSENGTHILPDIAESIRKTMEETFQGKAELIGVGIGVPGPVQPTSTPMPTFSMVPFPLLVYFNLTSLICAAPSQR